MVRPLFPFLVLFSLSFFDLRGEAIESVRFIGNQVLKTHSLLGIISTKKGEDFSAEKIERDVSVLFKFYQESGFFTPHISWRTHQGKKGKVVIFEIDEGVRCDVETVLFSGKKIPLIDGFLKKSFGFYSDEKVKKLEGDLREAYLNSGYYYVEVKVDTILIGPEKMNLSVRVDEGPLCYLSEIKFLGLQRVREKDAWRLSELKKGEIYSKKRLYSAAQRLYGTNLFRAIYFKVSSEREKAAGDKSEATESLSVRFDCQEEKERIFAFGLGYSSPPQRTYHSLTLEHLNFLRKLHNLKILSELSPNWRGSYSLLVKGYYRVPFIASTKINFLCEPYLLLERGPERKVWEIGEETGFSYEITKNLELSLFNKYRRRTGVIDSARGITNSVAERLLFDSRDDFFAPRNGFYSFSIIEYAGGLLGGTNDFWRLSQEVRFFFPLLFTQAVRLNLGLVLPYGRTKDLPDYEVFYLGGMTTLRGYDEKSLSGNQILLFNWETRFPLKKLFGGVLFFDLGFVKEIFYDFGVGLRLATPIAPLRLDYACVPERFGKKNWWKLNLGLGNVF